METTKRTPPRPRKSRRVAPAAELPKPKHTSVYATLAKDETLSGREQCMACEGGFEDDDAILIIRDHRLMIDYIHHCRCLTKIIEKGPREVDFESYREHLLVRYAPQ